MFIAGAFGCTTKVFVICNTCKYFTTTFDFFYSSNEEKSYLISKIFDLGMEELKYYLFDTL
jgi:hypothetical protein